LIDNKETVPDMPELKEVMTRPNLALAWYLMSCYLYYKRNLNVLSDEQFDMLCLYLLETWDEITHPHKTLITKEDLEAGTGYSIRYPYIIEHAANDWVRAMNTVYR